MSNKNSIVIYTAAFGKDYGIVPQKKIKNVGFVCFTDSRKKVSRPWKPIIMKNELSNHLKTRHTKILPHLYF